MRLNDISLKFKVGGAFTAIIFMALLFGIFSWTNTKKVQGMLGEIASWGDIDMVLNEDVVQNVIRLDSRYTEYRLKANQTNIEKLNNQYAITEQGIAVKLRDISFKLRPNCRLPEWLTT